MLDPYSARNNQIEVETNDAKTDDETPRPQEQDSENDIERKNSEDEAPRQKSFKVANPRIAETQLLESLPN